MANITPQDVRQNDELAQKLVESEDKQVSAIVGLHALGKLADLLPSQEFVNFVNEAVQAANATVQGQGAESATAAPSAQAETTTSPESGTADLA